jgi:hypothetical protein
VKTGWRTSTAALVAALVFSAPLAAQHRPPASPPAEWGPLSINLEEIQYPYPVRYLNLTVSGQDVRIAYMDVAPVGRANGQSVVLLHGGSYAELIRFLSSDPNVPADDR